MHDRQNGSMMPGRRAAIIAGPGLIAAAVAQAAGSDAMGAIAVAPSSARSTTAGAAAYFTGPVQVELLFTANGPARASGGSVTFEPGARSAWHTHPLGQVLIVTAGSGWVQLWGSPRQGIRQGDVVSIPPGLKHWHGATATMSLTHIAIQEGIDGRNVEWMEHVTDAQYRS